MDKTYWTTYDHKRCRELIDRMAVAVVKGSPLLNMTDKTAIGPVLERIAYGVVQAPYARMLEEDKDSFMKLMAMRDHERSRNSQAD